MNDGLTIFNQPQVDVRQELLALKLPCYASIRKKDGRCLTGRFDKLKVNCDMVDVTIVQERLNGKSIIDIPEKFTVNISDIKQVIKFQDILN